MGSLSFSQCADFARCEQYWTYKYQQDLRPPASKAMNLGTIVTAGCDAFYTGRGDVDVMALGLTSAAAGADCLEDVETISKAGWLVGRYAEHYAAEEYESYEPEVPIEWAYEGWSVKCRIDGLKTDKQGRLWVVERKTTSRPADVLQLAPHSPQVTMYDIACRAIGLDVYGIEYDVVNTYQWKNPRPVADSFDRLHFDKDATQRNQALLWLDSIIVRMEDIEAGAPAIRNVTRECNFCAFKGPCLEGFNFGDGITLTDG